MASVSEGSARVWSIVYGGRCVQELKSNGNKFESCIFHPGYSNVLVIGSNQVTKLLFLSLCLLCALLRFVSFKQMLLLLLLNNDICFYHLGFAKKCGNFTTSDGK